MTWAFRELVETNEYVYWPLTYCFSNVLCMVSVLPTQRMMQFPFLECPSSLTHQPWTFWSSKCRQKRVESQSLLKWTQLFRPLGMPILQKVTVFNLNKQNSIQMLSISGNTVHFHCSFFADKVLIKELILTLLANFLWFLRWFHRLATPRLMWCFWAGKRALCRTPCISTPRLDRSGTYWW